MSIPSLTIIFTPSPSCNSVSYYFDNEYFAIGEALPTSDCFPNGWDSSTTNYFSPEICPRGYSIGCSTASNSGVTTETIATRCPSNYGCLVNPTLFPWFSTRACGSLFLSGATLTVDSVTNGQTAMITTVITSPGGFNAFGVLVRWQSTDEEILSLLDPTMMSLKSTGSSQGPEATNSSIPSSPSAAVSVSSTSMMMTLPPNTPSATISKGSTAFETTISSPTSSASLILNGFAYTSEPTEPLQKTQTIDKLQILGTAGTSMTSGTSEAMPSTTTGLSENTTIYLGVSIPLVAAMIFALCIFRRSYQRRQAIIAGTPSNSSFANHGIRPGELFELRSEARELREPFELHNEPRGPFELHNGTISPNEMEGQSAFLIELYGERGLAR